MSTSILSTATRQGGQGIPHPADQPLPVQPARVFYCLEDKSNAYLVRCCSGRVDCIAQSLFLELVRHRDVSRRLRTPGECRQNLAAVVLDAESRIVRPPLVQKEKGCSLDQGNGAAEAGSSSLPRFDVPPARPESDFFSHGERRPTQDACRLFPDLPAQEPVCSQLLLLQVRSQRRGN